MTCFYFSGLLFSTYSYSHCEDGIDLTITNCGKIWKKHRPSLPAADNSDCTKKQLSLDTKQTNVVHTPAQENNVRIVAYPHSSENFMPLI
jgi:hypothetical protein